MYAVFFFLTYLFVHVSFSDFLTGDLMVVTNAPAPLVIHPD